MNQMGYAEMIPEEVPATKATILGPKVVFVNLSYDDDPEDPHECDGFGKIMSLNTRHKAFDKQGIDLALETNKDAIILSYYQHSGCMWSVRGEGVRDLFDTVDVAGVWIPDKPLLELAENLRGEKRRDKMLEWARQACELYTLWCNGWVYRYEISIYPLRSSKDSQPYNQLSDYRYETPEDLDSCCGLFGNDILKEATQEALQNLLS